MVKTSQLLPGAKIPGIQAFLLDWKPAERSFNVNDEGSEGFIILALWPKRNEFVTWYMDDGGQLSSGHYLFILRDAIKDFKERS